MDDDDDHRCGEGGVYLAAYLVLAALVMLGVLLGGGAWALLLR